MMLENIQMLIEYRNLSTQDIMKYLNDNSTFSELKFISAIVNFSCNDFDATISNVFKDKKNSKNLDKEDIGLLKGFFSILGRSNLEGQISNCNLYKEFFKHKLKMLEDKEATECKTKSTLITALGFALIILII